MAIGRGGARNGAGRPVGSFDKPKTPDEKLMAALKRRGRKERRVAREKVERSYEGEIAANAQTPEYVAAAKEQLTSVTFLQKCYRDENLSKPLRIDCAKAAAPYEYQRKPIALQVTEQRALNINIVNFCDLPDARDTLESLESQSPSIDDLIGDIPPLEIPAPLREPPLVEGKAIDITPVQES